MGGGGGTLMGRLGAWVGGLSAGSVVVGCFETGVEIGVRVGAWVVGGWAGRRVVVFFMKLGSDF